MLHGAALQAAVSHSQNPVSRKVQPAAKQTALVVIRLQTMFLYRLLHYPDWN